MSQPFYYYCVIKVWVPSENSVPAEPLGQGVPKGKADVYDTVVLATDKNRDSGAQGGPWTPLFEELFADSGMGLDDDANLVNLLNHAGPHPKEYHIEVYRRLRSAVARCTTQHGCRTQLLKALREIAEEVCTPGTELNRLATRSKP